MVEIGLPGAAAELLRGRIIFFPDLEDEPVVFIVEVCGMLLCLSFGFAERFPSLLPFDFGRLKEDMVNLLRLFPSAGCYHWWPGGVDSWVAGSGSAYVGVVRWSILASMDLIHRRGKRR